MYKKFINTFIFLILLFIPLIINGRLYYLGGDDMRLYYLFPGKYLENYVFNTIGGNTLAGANTGYATVAYYAPMFYFIKFLKLIPLNTQFLMFGLNLSLGFLFFYKFIGLYIKRSWYARTTASLMYVLSPFLIDTYYRSQMLSMYLVSVLPLVMYLFFKGIRKNKYLLTFSAVVVFSVFTTTINTIPWWSAFFISTIFLVIYEFIKRPKLMIIHLLLSAITFSVLNWYWMGDFIKSQVDPGGIASGAAYYKSQPFADDNIRVATGVSGLYKPFNVILNSPQYSIFKANITDLLNLFLIAVVLVAGSVLKGAGKTKILKYSLFLISFLLSWYMYSPNLGEFGRKLFIYMTRHLPLFGMYRNMFDKFSLSLAFFFALLVGYSIYVCSRKSKFLAKASSFIIIILITAGSWNFMSFRYTNSQETSRLTGYFNNDFNELVNYLKNTPDSSKVLWLPLNYPTYLNIEDKNLDGHYYSGLSPLRILADRSDYAGGFSFITENDYFTADKLWALMKNKDYEKIGRLFQSRNAKYIVLDNQQLPEQMLGYLYGGEGYPILNMQDSSFMANILGDKIKTFGERYELYKISSPYDSEPVYITGNNENLYEGKNDLVYKKISNKEYEIEMTRPAGEQINLILLEPFNTGWKLIAEDGSELKLEHKDVFGYANVWNITKDEIPLTANRNIFIKFIK